MTKKVKHVVVFLRVHQRAQYLEEIFDQLTALRKGRKMHVVVRLDRPSKEVILKLNEVTCKFGQDWVSFLDADPIRTENGADWVSSLNDMWEFSKDLGDFDAGMLWDDDMLLTPAALRELRLVMHHLIWDKIDVRWANPWDDRKIKNKNIHDYFATILFKYHRKDTWCRAANHCPDYVAVQGTAKQLKGFGLHLGYLTHEDREYMISVLKETGQITWDRRALFAEPELIPFDEPC